MQRVEAEILYYKTEKLSNLERIQRKMANGISQRHFQTIKHDQDVQLPVGNEQLHLDAIASKSSMDRCHQKGRPKRGLDALTEQLCTELGHKKATDDMKTREEKMRRVKGILRERRMRSIRVRHHYQEMHLGMRSKMIADISDTTSTEVRRPANSRAHLTDSWCHEDWFKKQPQDEVLENFYLDRMESLAEDFAEEIKNLKNNIKESHRAFADEKIATRKKMVDDIKVIQNDVLRISKDLRR